MVGLDYFLVFGTCLALAASFFFWLGRRRRGQRTDLVAEASVKDIELFVDRHLVKLALGNLLFQKDKFAPEVELRS
jgi:hypothetical protein